MSAPVCLHVGSYRRRGGAGVYALHRDADGFSLHGAYGETPDWSWAVQSSRTGLVYMVEETEVGRIGVHRCDSTRRHRMARVATDRLLAVVDEESDSVVLLDVGADGSLASAERQVDVPGAACVFTVQRQPFKDVAGSVLS